DYILPSSCLVCGSGENVVNGLCQTCRGQLRSLGDQVCEICGVPLPMGGVCLGCQQDPPPYDRMLSAAGYEGIIRDIILAFKYHRTTIFKGVLGRMLSDLFFRINQPIDILTFVPMNYKRQVSRGYNQSALLARELSRHTGVQVGYDLIKKTRVTPPQEALGALQRKENLKGAFEVKKMKGQSIMIVDDVITTGATAREISGAFRKAGARKVFFISVSRTLS
ncbi:MAG: ComF family protein, partial [Thermodesulfobacteriota bacterium]|nr:ComF family protein [Thermodesulfobacteriota bacterium]